VAVLRQAEMDAMCPATREAQQPTNARFCVLAGVTHPYIYAFVCILSIATAIANCALSSAQGARRTLTRGGRALCRLRGCWRTDRPAQRGAAESDALIGFAVLGDGDLTTRGWPRAPAINPDELAAQALATEGV
jgi:hypothetical protein